MRQSHQALKAPAISIDTKSKSVHRPHHVDLRTGLYRGVQVLFREDPATPGAGDTPKG
jgi:large subunit ribosomal protein L32